MSNTVNTLPNEIFLLIISLYQGTLNGGKFYAGSVFVTLLCFQIGNFHPASRQSKARNIEVLCDDIDILENLTGHIKRKKQEISIIAKDFVSIQFNFSTIISAII